MGKRLWDDGWGYLEQSPSTVCLVGPLVTPQRNFRSVELPSLGQHALSPLLPIEAHGYYRAHGSGHSRLAMRAAFQV